MADTGVSTVSAVYLQYRDYRVSRGVKGLARGFCASWLVTRRSLHWRCGFRLGGRLSKFRLRLKHSLFTFRMVDSCPLGYSRIARLGIPPICSDPCLAARRFDTVPAGFCKVNYELR